MNQVLQPLTEDDQNDVPQALADVVQHPHRTIVCAWSWKTAAVSAVVRAAIFLGTNRPLHRHAVASAVAEAIYGLIAAGFIGALTQRLRFTRPLWITAWTIWIVLPTAMVAAEYEVHRLMHTPHVRVGLLASFIIAAVSSGFTWFAMRRGVLLQGEGDDRLLHDLFALPRILREFIAWPFQRTERVP